jgi:hypothetical protein
MLSIHSFCEESLESLLLFLVEVTPRLSQVGPSHCYFLYPLKVRGLRGILFGQLSELPLD